MLYCMVLISDNLLKVQIRDREVELYGSDFRY